MVWFLLLAGIAIMFLVFGWQVAVPGLLLGLLGAIWLIRRDRAKEMAAGPNGQTQMPEGGPATVDVDQWYIEDTERGNRFMIDDALDLPGTTSEEDRLTVRQDLWSRGFQKNHYMLSWRQKIMNDPEYLSSPEGIEATNAMGGIAFDYVNQNVRGWKTNDFRKIGLELLLD